MAKRRPKGDGMIRRRKDGRWEGRIVVGHKENGSRIYKYVFAKTQKELLPKFHQLKEQYAGMEARIMTWDGEKGKGIDDFFNRLPLAESINGLRGMIINEFEHEFHPRKHKESIELHQIICYNFFGSILLIVL